MKRKLNIELLTKLKRRFERMRHPQHFNMKPVAMQSDCGAVMCIAGHTLDLAGYKMRRRVLDEVDRMCVTGRVDFDFISPKTGKAITEDPLYVAAKELGLGMNEDGSYLSDDAHELFHDFNLKTPKQAATRIRRIIETGTVAPNCYKAKGYGYWKR